MTNRSAASKKPLLKTIHTWIGIVSGVVLSAVALTGSVILFRGEFERASMPRSGSPPDTSRRTSIDEAARAVAAMRPDSHIRRVRIPAAPGDPYVFQVQSSGKRTERIVADASTGQILGALESGWVDWMVDLHRNLLSGDRGRTAVGAIGIVLFTLSSTGLLMWLTGPRNWRAWVSVRKGGTATRFNYELHRASGLWAYGFLALISFTGVELSYPNAFRSAVQWITGKPATVPGPKRIQADAMLSLDEYVRIGRGAMPDGVPVELRLQEPGRGPVDLRLRRAGDLSPSGNHVYLDPASGSVLMIDRVVDRPAGARFLAAMAPLHYAQFGGITVKIAWALFALAPVLLFLTGLIAWWRPRRSRSGQPAYEQTGEDLALAGR
jgi:uncharacterized iron-regulated membrane protein